VAVLGFYNWVLQLGDDALLIWHQDLDFDDGRSAPITFSVFRPRESSVLAADLESICASMDADRQPAVYGSDPGTLFSLDTTEAGHSVSAPFPDEMRDMKELLLWCHSSGVQRPDPHGANNVALIVARPAESTYHLYPQDWFNISDVDFGYQWVTRVMRDSRTGRVHGEGIRISPFMLDASLRALA